MTKPLKIGVVGASGRMGRMVINNILLMPGCELSGASEVSGSKYLGADSGFLVGAENNGIIITDDTEKMFMGLDVVIDFTIPDATQKHAEIASNTGCALIVGTTGMEESHQAALLSASNNVPIVCYLLLLNKLLRRSVKILILKLLRCIISIRLIHLRELLWDLVRQRQKDEE